MLDGARHFATIKTKSVTMKEKLVSYYKRVRFLLGIKPSSLEIPTPPPELEVPPMYPELGRKKRFLGLRLKGWHLSKRAKLCVVACVVIAVILVSTFAFLSGAFQINAIKPSANDSANSPSPSPTPVPKATNAPSDSPTQNPVANDIQSPQPTPTQSKHPPGVITSSPVVNSTVWEEVAAYAWAYFQPGVGVDPSTGLLYASLEFHGFTDWDLGGYIQAVIDAQELGLVGTNDSDGWGSYARFNYVLTFLETRPLNNYSYPYQFYYSNGQPDLTDSCNETVDIVDIGRLLVALNNLRDFSETYNLNLTQRINNLVYDSNNNGVNYTALVPDIQSNMQNSNSIYAYYIDSGFGSFFPAVANASEDVMNNIVNSPTIQTFNVTLPDVPLTGDPLFCSVFELNNNDSQLMNLAYQFYNASAAEYNATGKYAAFSEGGAIGAYVYEWVVDPYGQVWTISSVGQTSYDMEPIIFTKIAFSFLALYNTTYARNMAIFLEAAMPEPTYGYCEGADNYGDNIANPGSNSNSLILDAALYAIQKSP